ncbi:hypothetical protein DPEC_G00247730 [Dallia pectoralis]|uniref:Uncharacterized protein n=1 Tax=Dallia pectoralis TaxID=75939 RepID=A0ACC2FWL5_DALPE|nr:hypothetical protein DPEC_G00247730 [Dallia pectoralis]
MHMSDYFLTSSGQGLVYNHGGQTTLAECPSSSPSPSHWLVPGCPDKGAICPGDQGRETCLPPPVAVGSAPLLRMLSYGEGIQLDPIPPKEIRYTSSVHYDSERHFIHSVAIRPGGLDLERYSQAVLTVPHSTWRHYKTQLEFQPRQRARQFQSTTIIYPKHARTSYTTELSYDSHRLAKRFLSSIELRPLIGESYPSEVKAWHGLG